MDPVSLGLPHRAPFIFIEEVLTLEAEQSASAQQRFRGDEAYFAGHFPGNAIVPGVLLSEGMAQTAGIAIGGPGRTYFLTAIRTMKFYRPLHPPVTVVFQAHRQGSAGDLVQVQVEARAAGQLVAEGVIVLSLNASATPPQTTGNVRV